jgi:hypothetical protein
VVVLVEPLRIFWDKAFDSSMEPAEITRGMDSLIKGENTETLQTHQQDSIGENVPSRDHYLQSVTDAVRRLTQQQVVMYDEETGMLF